MPGQASLCGWRHANALLGRHPAMVLAVGCAVVTIVGHITGGRGGAGLPWDLVALAIAALGDWSLVTSAVGYGGLWVLALVLAPGAPMLMDSTSFIPVAVAGLRGAGTVQLWASVAYVILMFQPWHVTSVSDAWLRFVLSTGMFVIVWFITESIRMAGERERGRAADLLRGQRRRIARDLHDGAVHRLSLLSMRVQRIQMVGPAAPELLEPVLDEIDETIRDLRQMMSVLREAEPPEPRDPPTSRGDCLIAARRIEAAGFRLLCEMPEEFSPLSPLVAGMFGDVVREAANNVLRHGSKRDLVVLRVACTEASIEFQLQNAFDDSAEGGPAGRFGLEMLAEDVRHLGGDLTSAAAEGRWTLRLVLPAAESPSSHPREA